MMLGLWLPLEYELASSREWAYCCLNIHHDLTDNVKIF